MSKLEEQLKGKPRLIIHIGYPKTGTTTLQKHVFSKHSEIEYLSDLSSESGPLPFLEDIFYARENSVRFYASNYYEAIEKRISQSDKSIFVLSEESFTSFAMFFRDKPYPYKWTVDPNSIARKLKTVFCEGNLFSHVKVLLTIRRQEDMLRSIYAQMYNLIYKRNSITSTFERFIDYSLGLQEKGFVVDSLDYCNVVREYESLFGEDNVNVLVFEELVEEASDYVFQLSEIIGVSSISIEALIEGKTENKKSGTDGYQSDDRTLFEISVAVWRKYFKKPGVIKTPKFFSLLAPFLKNIRLKGRVLDDLQIPEAALGALASRFSEGNKELSAKKNLNLEDYGYLVHSEKL